MNEVVQAIISVMHKINDNISEINGQRMQKNNAGTIGDNVKDTSDNSKGIADSVKEILQTSMLLKISNVSQTSENHV